MIITGIQAANGVISSSVQFSLVIQLINQLIEVVNLNYLGLFKWFQLNNLLPMIPTPHQDTWTFRRSPRQLVLSMAFGRLGTAKLYIKRTHVAPCCHMLPHWCIRSLNSGWYDQVQACVLPKKYLTSG